MARKIFDSAKLCIIPPHLAGQKAKQPHEFPAHLFAPPPARRNGAGRLQPRFRRTND